MDRFGSYEHALSYCHAFFSWYNGHHRHDGIAMLTPDDVHITYADNHWDLLRVIEKDGALELDNGDVERVIRGPAIGRRNWLFAGSDNGGERAAIILSVIETAARADVDLRAYLHDVLVKLSSGWKMSRLDELLPENWALSDSDA